MQPPQVTYTPREESQWLAVLIDARTGRFMDQLDVFGTPTVDDTVNQTTRVAISVPKRQARDLVPMHHGVALLHGDHVLVAGPLTENAKDAGRDWASLPFAGIEAVFEGWHALGETEFVTGDELRTATASHVDAGSLGSVAWNIVDQAMRRLGRLPIVHGTPYEEGSVGYPDIPTWNLEKNRVGDLLAEISKGIGPDIAFWPRLNEDRSGVEWEMVHGTFAQPMIEQTRMPYIDLTADGVGVAALEPARDWKSLATRVYGVGAGQEAGQLVSMSYVDRTRQMAMIPRERLVNSTSTDDWPELQRIVDGEAQVSSFPIRQLDLTLSIDDSEAGLWAWRPGHACCLLVGDDWLDIPAGESTCAWCRVRRRQANRRTW